ncbi:FMN-binding negative transcriptional regulator [Streptomyces sp. NPDC002012]|uniref:FMN-binding negative transcriptional regulator n=1 Tax=unclassified Streptomyces TaxID=2593676 RepID=UPI00332474FA
MFIQPWDAGLDEAEWQTWITEGHDFGVLSVNSLHGHPPIAVPTHFTSDGPHLLVHLARPNPVWKAIEHDPNVVLTVTGDYAFIPGHWRAKVGTPPTDGVPTSYYTAVQFTCRAHIVDDPEAKAEMLEIIYADTTGVLTRHWNHRDTHRTRVTEDSTHVAFVLETLHATRDGHLLKAAAEELQGMLALHAEQTAVYYLSPAQSQVTV